MPIFLIASALSAIPIAAAIGWKAARNSPVDISGGIRIPTQAALAAEKRKVNMMSLALGAVVAYKVYGRK